MNQFTPQEAPADLTIYSPIKSFLTSITIMRLSLDSRSYSLYDDSHVRVSCRDNAAFPRSSEPFAVRGGRQHGGSEDREQDG